MLSGDCLPNTFPTLVLSSLFYSFLNTNTAYLHLWGDHLFVSDKIFLIVKQKPRGWVSKQLLGVSWVDKRLERRQTWGKCLLCDFRDECWTVLTEVARTAFKPASFAWTQTKILMKISAYTSFVVAILIIRGNTKFLSQIRKYAPNERIEGSFCLSSKACFLLPPYTGSKR